MLLPVTWPVLPFCLVLFEQWHSACYLTLLNALVCRSDPLNFSDDLLTVSNNGKAGSVALVGASVTQGVAKWEFILLSDDSSACLGVAIKPAQCTLRWCADPLTRLLATSRVIAIVIVIMFRASNCPCETLPVVCNTRVPGFFSLLSVASCRSCCSCRCGGVVVQLRSTHSHSLPAPAATRCCSGASMAP